MIIYLHGYASIGNGEKSQLLRDYFGSSHVVSPNLPVDPDQVENIIDELVQKYSNESIVFVGTSLGGFWANYAAQKYSFPCVIVNPAACPSISLKKYMTATINKFYIGEIHKITQEILDGYDKREQWVGDNTNPLLINLFAAEDDNIINFKQTLLAFPLTNCTIIKSTGGHQFIQHWGEVMRKVRQISYSSSQVK